MTSATTVGLHDQIYLVTAIGLIVEGLRESGIRPADALRRAGLTSEQLSSASTLVSLQQMLQVADNASRLVTDPGFAYRTGLRFHITTYGMYGFAILSCTNFRDAARFAQQYQMLANPLTEISFSEHSGRAVWTIGIPPRASIDRALQRFLIEMHLGLMLTVHRDVIGPEFAPSAIEVTFERPLQAPDYETIPACTVAYERPEIQFAFNSAWLDRQPPLASGPGHEAAATLCAQMLTRLQKGSSVTGRVREVLVRDLSNGASFDRVCSRLNASPRTLRRVLQTEGSSFREIADTLRSEIATRYLRDTGLAVEDIAFALGFSDAVNFRRAFRRWTGRSPQQVRSAQQLGTKSATSAH